MSGQIYQTETILETIYQTGSLFKVFARGVYFFVDAASRIGEIVVPPLSMARSMVSWRVPPLSMARSMLRAMARQLMWTLSRCSHGRETLREDGTAIGNGETVDMDVVSLLLLARSVTWTHVKTASACTMLLQCFME